jgi:proteasome lid subunit RPN8/RPN11
MEGEVAQDTEMERIGSAAVWKESNDVFRPTPAPLILVLGALCRTRPGADSTVVLVSEAVMAEIFFQLKSRAEVEMGGVLVGSAFADLDSPLHAVVVRRGVLGDNSEGTPVSLKLTSDSWQSINSKLPSLPEEQRNIVGWYHSHPGLGVFLSARDLSTQRSFFANPWQIALVVDPKRDAFGFFYGCEGLPAQTIIYRTELPEE